MNNIISMGKHNKTFDVDFHCHDNWEIIYCTSGNGKISEESGNFVLYQQNDLIAIPPKCMHSNTSETGFTNIFLTFDDALFPFKTTTKFTDNNELHLYSCISACYYYWYSEANNKNALLENLGELLSNYLFTFTNTNFLSPQVELLKNDIYKNFSDTDFTVSKSMSKIFLNNDYLRKMFKAETKVSPSDFLTQIRIEASKKFLSQNINKLSVTEIAHLSGFADPLYFSRVFKKHCGISPKTFMDNNKI